MTYEQWMKHVDGLLLAASGMTTNDIPDRLYRDLYDAGQSPAEVVAEIIMDGHAGAMRGIRGLPCAAV